VTLNFAMRTGDGSAVYAGPHGPMTIGPGHESGRATVLTPVGESAIEWSRDLADDERLEGEGVAVHIAGTPSARLRREGPSLMLVEDDGAVRSILCRRRFGKMRLERPDGAELATLRVDKGRVADAAEPADIALMLLIMASRVDQRLDRPVLALGA